MKRVTRNILLLVAPVTLAALGLASYRLVRLLSIGAAYKAKTLCSGVFLAGREPASVLAEELSADDLSLLRHVDARIDYLKKEVTSGVFGIVRRRARFVPGLGCHLCYPAVERSLTAATSPAPPPATTFDETHDPRLDPVLDWAFSEQDPNRLKRTRAIVVLHKGRIVAERYAPGFSKDTPLLGWSMTKSVTSALVGILVKEGRLSLDRPLPVPEWQGPADRRKKITLNHLLQMTSGLRFGEEYGNPFQDVIHMLFSTPDAAAYAAGKPLDAEPGTVWSYSSGTTNIISRIIHQTVGDAAYLSFPRKALFDPLGMQSAVIESDASGTLLGSSFMYATARDWARFGQLYLQDGLWEGERILPQGWVKYSITPAPQAPEGQYGAHFWLRVPNDFSSQNRGSGVPADAFHAVGHEGQVITVIPSRELVMVRLGLARHPGAWEQDTFIALVLKALHMT